MRRSGRIVGAMDDADEVDPVPQTGVGGLEDGSYDAFVVEAAETADGGTHLDLTITVGEHKGQVVSVASTAPLGDPLDLLGMPATVVVSFGLPSVRIDR